MVAGMYKSAKVQGNCKAWGSSLAHDDVPCTVLGFALVLRWLNQGERPCCQSMVSLIAGISRSTITYHVIKIHSLVGPGW